MTGFAVLVRWCDVYGSISVEVFSVGVSEEKLGPNDEQVLSIRQPNADDVHVVAVPGGTVVVAGGVYGDAEVWSETVHAFRRFALPNRCSHQWVCPKGLDVDRGSDLARVRYRIRESGIGLPVTLFSGGQCSRVIDVTQTH